MEIHHQRRCVICESREFSSHGHYLERCLNCGLIKIRQRQSADQTVLEQVAWFDTMAQDASPLLRLFERLRNRKVLRRLAKLQLPGNRLLEIGVGTGSFLMAAQRAGFDLHGFDVSPALVRHVSDKLGVPMYTGAIEQIPSQLKFDVVVMNHVLEHVADPIGLLAAVRNLLAPGGFAHIAVPNVDCWEAALPGWNSYEPYHLVYFNGETLSKALAAANFTQERLITCESFSGWFLALMRTALRVDAYSASPGARPSQGVGSFVKEAYRACMAIFGLLTWPLRMFQQACGRGDELIAIARRTR